MATIALLSDEMLVYRIEDPVDHSGAYTCTGHRERSLLGYAMADVHCPKTGHPGPWEDPLIKRAPHDGEIFGCATYAEIRRWFEDFWNDLDDVGFVLGLYRARDSMVTRGTGQVMFNRFLAQRVGEFKMGKI